MSKYTIAGAFGADDHCKCKNIASVINFLNNDGRLAYGIEDVLHVLYSYNIQPTEIGIDVLIVAAMVYAADTRISRKDTSQDNWTREIHLVIPVSNKKKWESVSTLLQGALNFLTGDRWSLEFKLRPENALKLAKTVEPTLVAPKFDSLALFSGGLDSLIDAINVLEEGKTPLLVSHCGDGVTSNAQKKLLECLKQHYGNDRLEQLRLWMTFPDNLIPNVTSEDTTRGRSFLFIAIGVLAGTGLADVTTLRIPENGFIALNVPLDPMRLGALSTRTTHPFYLAQWNKILSGLNAEVQVENIYRHMTKGEMTKGCSNINLLCKTSPLSVSCSAPTKGRWSGKSPTHCGYCVPCIIRQAALVHGLDKDPTDYLCQLSNTELNSMVSEGAQARSFKLAIDRLKRLPGIEHTLIHKPGPLTDVATEWKELAGVYARGLHEVNDVLANTTVIPK